jgi:hypothetical protein
MDIKVNIHGLIAMVLIAVMVILALIYRETAPILYVALAVILYLGTVVLINNMRETQAEDKRRIVAQSRQLLQIRVLYGAHIAFFLVILGLFLSLDFLMQIVYFVGAIVFGMLIPFVVVTRAQVKQ